MNKLILFAALLLILTAGAAELFTHDVKTEKSRGHTPISRIGQMDFPLS